MGARQLSERKNKLKIKNIKCNKIIVNSPSVNLRRGKVKCNLRKWVGKKQITKLILMMNDKIDNFLILNVTPYFLEKDEV